MKKADKPLDIIMHRVQISPIHRFTDSPIHRFTDSPIHRFTDSPIHRFTDSGELYLKNKIYNPLHNERTKGTVSFVRFFIFIVKGGCVKTHDTNGIACFHDEF